MSLIYRTQINTIPMRRTQLQCGDALTEITSPDVPTHSITGFHTA